MFWWDQHYGKYEESFVCQNSGESNFNLRRIEWSMIELEQREILFRFQRSVVLRCYVTQCSDTRDQYQHYVIILLLILAAWLARTIWSSHMHVQQCLIYQLSRYKIFNKEIIDPLQLIRVVVQWCAAGQVRKSTRAWEHSLGT